LSIIEHSTQNLADVEGIFNITPITARIPANQTALFEVTFNPDSKNNLFAKEFIGYVFTKQEEYYSYEEILAFPMITSVRLIGARILSRLRNYPIIII